MRSNRGETKNKPQTLASAQRDSVQRLGINPAFETELETAVRLARRAGRVIMDLYSEDVAVTLKAGEEPVTRADQLANDLITTALAEAFPDDGILAEESSDKQSWLGFERVWMVDPLDGTKEFINHNGEFAVMIGLMIGHEPVLGVVYQPADDRLYTGIQGGLCTLTVGSPPSGEELVKNLCVSECGDPRDSVMLMSRSHADERVLRLAKHLDVKALKRSGSVGVKMGLMADNQADLYVHFTDKTKLWDVCAPTAILTAAGGRVTDTLGDPLDFRSPTAFNLHGLAATNGLQHRAVLDAIAAIG